MLAYRDARGGAEVAFTDRHGGVSAGPYASLNLGYGVGDDVSAVDRNVALAVAAFTDADPRARLTGLRQVHGADVHLVGGKDDRAAEAVRSSSTPHAPGPPRWPTADALVTTEPGTVLLVRAADCVPVLLAALSADGAAVAAVHAGRSGLVEGVVTRAVTRLRALVPERSADIVAWIGPHVCGACYEVPAGMRDDVAAVVPQARATTSWGTASLDLGAGVVAQLRASGVDDIVDARRCTREDDDLFSYRRQGAASGRLGGLVWIRP
ncbi:MAG TPA: peptidoglycan editing factor PgeF [Nocardioidaceae bacterium]|nr:peptidoglycan editing factor PgeF [Nocardioidaceae bacterium]